MTGENKAGAHDPTDADGTAKKSEASPPTIQAVRDAVKEELVAEAKRGPRQHGSLIVALVTMWTVGVAAWALATVSSSKVPPSREPADAGAPVCPPVMTNEAIQEAVLAALEQLPRTRIFSFGGVPAAEPCQCNRPAVVQPAVVQDRAARRTATATSNNDCDQAPPGELAAKPAQP
jgi:hypothetical protein